MKKRAGKSMGLKFLVSSCFMLLLLLLLLRPISAFFLPSTRNIISSRPRAPSSLHSSFLFSLQQASSCASSSSQVLQFQEPTTNTTVVLVGSMHYNPASMELASSTVKQFAQSNQLGSVLVEACDVRWNSTLELHDKKPLLKHVLQNEMRAASNMADRYHIPVVLGDQRINITTTRLKSAFQETLLDILTLNWKELYRDLQEAVDVALPYGEGYMDAKGFFNFQLLMAAPVSLVKYPLSYVVRAPLASIAFLSLLTLLPSVADTADPLSQPALTFQDVVGSLAFAALEIVVFLRVFVQVLLAERNEVLARNIKRQCEIYAVNKETKKKRRGRFLLARLFRRKEVAMADNNNDEEEIVYAPPPPSCNGVATSTSIVQNNNKDNDDSKEKKVVVAVLGMAHCNGIKKLLREEMV